MLLREAEAAAAQNGHTLEQKSFLAPLLQGRLLGVPLEYNVCHTKTYRAKWAARQLGPSMQQTLSSTALPVEVTHNVFLF